MTEYFFLIGGLTAALLPILMLWAMRRSLALVLLKDSRPSRILHYLLLALFGASLSVSSCEGLLTPHLLLRFLLFFFMLFYAGQFAIVTNNIEDLEADKITNQNRPLVREQIPQKLYFRIGLGCQGIALALAAWVGQAELLTIGAISLLYYLYSVPPFRLKRYVLLAKFLIGINSFLVAVYGFVLAGGKAMEFPVHWAVFILVPVSLMANFIDLKDTEGDRHAGIKTLPVLIGQRRATYFMAAATMCTYTYAAILLSNVYVSLLIAGVSLIHLYLLLRVPYTEKPLFLLHNSLFLGLIVLHLILK